MVPIKLDVTSHKLRRLHFKPPRSSQVLGKRKIAPTHTLILAPDILLPEREDLRWLHNALHGDIVIAWRPTREYTMECDKEETAAKPVAHPFRFFDLPFELRLRIYEFAVLAPQTVDLYPTNHRTLAPYLRPFFVSHGMHEEAYRVFYGGNTFRVFPVHGRFFHTKAPLLARLSPRYRAVITKLELRLGPGWTKPPRCWVVNKRLGLFDMEKLRKLNIYIDCDPSSHPAFEGYGQGKHWYTEFCVNLVQGLFAQAPSIADVEFDGVRGVEKSSPLLQALLEEAKTQSKRISWGPERRWNDIVEVVTIEIAQSMMQKLGLDRRQD